MLYYCKYILILIMKIKDQDQKKKIVNRLRRIEGQIRGVIQMVEDESPVSTINQQLSAIRSAVTNSLYEEFFFALEKILVKKDSQVSEKDVDELRWLLKNIR